MIKKILLIAGTTALLFTGIYKALLYKRSIAMDEVEASGVQLIIAIYDTASNQIIKTTQSEQHQTLRWINNAEDALAKEALNGFIEKKQSLFIHLQIWPRGIIKKLDDSIASLVISGYYDKKLTTLFKLLNKNTTLTYLSYNAAMEVPSYQLPWQAQSFNEYIRSFRHIFSLCKKFAPSVQIVWSPSGYPGAEEYWPGNDFVDQISINLNMDREFANDRYPLYPSVAEMMRRKLLRMRFTNKPILFLGSTTVNSNDLNHQILNDINRKIIADKAFYRTPKEAAEPDTIYTKKDRIIPIQLGVYDPLLLLTNQPLISTEHIFTDMVSVLNGFFKKNFDSVIARRHNVIVTMEPWKDGKRVKDPAILANTINGTYDRVWAKLYEIIADAPQTVYLRWGHEMEIPIDRYAWQSMDPVAYIKAFRYVANFKQPRPTNIKMVWGPAGDRGSVEWYPGKDVVDFVSFAIYGLPDKNINDYNKQQSFSTIFQYKFHRMRFTHRPIFITEFGVKGPEAYQKKWLLNAATTINKYPEIYGLSYFNFADTPKAWGDAETPDWSITDSTFKSFTNLLKYTTGI